MNFVTREQWNARPPTAPYSPIHSTVTTGHWEGPHMGTFPHSACPAKVRGIQAFHMDSNGWSDIAYNGVACPHGYVFEGRGPGHRSAANGTNAGNDTSTVICYLGGEGDPFTPEGAQAMTDGAAWLGAPMAKGHRDWIATACPGDVIYGWIHGARPPEPEPEPPAEDDDTMNYTICAGDGPGQWLTDMATFKTPILDEDDFNATLVCLRASGAKVHESGLNTPVRVPQKTLDKFKETTP